MRLPLVALALLILPACAGPADPPSGSDSTDIFIARLRSEDGVLRAGPPLRVTDRDDYDNQPCFNRDGSRLLFSSRRGNQVDIYAFDLEQGKLRQVTQTLENEYSPTAIPEDSRFSVVRVERDGRQRLWAFGEESGLPDLLLPRPEFVGYHAWADSDTLVVYLLGPSPSLRSIDLSGKISGVLAEDIGRSLQRVPGKRAISFVSKTSQDEWWIHELDLATGEHSPVVATLPGGEHHAWLPDGDLLMAQDSSILRWGPGTLGLWVEVADYTGEDIGSITRLAVDPRGETLAFVAAH